MTMLNKDDPAQAKLFTVLGIACWNKLDNDKRKTVLRSCGLAASKARLSYGEILSTKNLKRNQEGTATFAALLALRSIMGIKDAETLQACSEILGKSIEETKCYLKELYQNLDAVRIQMLKEASLWRP